MSCKSKCLFGASLSLSMPTQAFAHPAEQALVLLLPTELYTFGGTLAVLASIILISFAPSHGLGKLYRGFGIRRAPSFGTAPEITSLFSTLTFFLLLYVGLTGPNDPQSNLLPQVIWTGWWVGLFIAQGVFGDIWRWINPWSGLCALLFERNTPLLTYPARLGAWPALVIFVLFQLFLLADIAPSDPDRLATFALLYWLFTLIGMVLFGPAIWARNVECFSVLFRLIASLRPIQCEGEIRVGIAGWASFALAPLDTARAMFCLTILVSGSFDGLRETFWWLGQIGINPLEFPGRSAVVWTSAIGLIVANTTIIFLYAASIFAGLILARRFGTLGLVAFSTAFRTYAITILPIALGYHFAHYFVSFLVQIQYLAATLGDPLARGWNLFGLGDFRVTTGFLNSTETVRPILLINVGAVVFSHIVSIAMAHHLSGRFAHTRRDLILIQLFLSILMILYTMFGLWLLSTPRGA
ncbi:MAG: hypothetical protein WA782_05740 [Sulfitobacter sp.]